MIMTGFTTHCLKNWLVKGLLWLFVLMSGMVQAQAPVVHAPVLQLECLEDGLWLGTQLQFDLSATVVDALHKGIAIYFAAQANVLQERWYWSNKKISTAKRYLRLAYQPLTRRWRVNVGFGDIAESALGLSLTQMFESLPDALAAVQRISHWKIAESADIRADATHQVEFRFYLDLTQLPRPLQIGTLGQSDWLVSLESMQSLSAKAKP